MADETTTGGTARLDAEWIALTAFRGLTKIATNDDVNHSTYGGSLEFGGALYPELLGPQASILQHFRESDTTREYRQRARLRSIRDGTQANASQIIADDIRELKELIAIAERESRINTSTRARADQLKNRLARLVAAEKEINPVSHTENQLIFRDAYNVERSLPAIGTGQGHRDFQLPNGKIMRVRVLHPDTPEHVTGADIIYERHSPSSQTASIVAIQYKLWADKKLYLTDNRMAGQLARLRGFLCDKGVCEQQGNHNSYRFPFCSAFLKPTDRLQRADQKYMSSGEHLPICKVDECKTVTTQGASILEYDGIRHTSLNSETFDFLFYNGKIGSRLLSYAELVTLYVEHLVALAEDNVVIHAQEFDDVPTQGHQSHAFA